MRDRDLYRTVPGLRAPSPVVNGASDINGLRRTT